MKLTKPIIAFVSLVIFASACSDNQEEFPDIELQAKPENATNFLEINIDDATYLLEEGVDDCRTGQLLIGSAYATSISKSQEISYYLAYNYEAHSQNEIINQLVKQEQQILLQEFQNGEIVVQINGFLLEINESEFVGGPRSGYTSAFHEQPTTSFFTIDDFYAGDISGTIGLAGSFNIKISGVYEDKEITGRFLLDFPIGYQE